MGVCYSRHAADGLESNGRSDIEVVQEPEVGCDAMTHPIVHVVILAAAILIPGGLLVYFAWRARTRCKKKAAKSAPEEAREAFLKMYPPLSLRAKNRLQQLRRARAYRRRNPNQK